MKHSYNFATSVLHERAVQVHTEQGCSEIGGQLPSKVLVGQLLTLYQPKWANCVQPDLGSFLRDQKG